MKSFVNATLLASAFACLGFCTSAFTAEPEKKVEFFPGDVKYTSNPASPAQSAVLFGDPSKPGMYVLRVRIPANTRLPVHTHPDSVRIVSILSGTLYFGYGERFEESKLIAYGPGSFYKEPVGAAHYSWTKEGEVICDVIGIGPSTTVLVKQADAAEK